MFMMVQPFGFSYVFVLLRIVTRLPRRAHVRIKGILQESQAVHELMAATVQEAAKSGCDANKAQSLIHKKFKANSMQKKGKLSTEVSRESGSRFRTPPEAEIPKRLKTKLFPRS